MFTEILKANVGRCLRLEVGHELRPTPEVVTGCVAGLYSQDTILALIVWRRLDTPIEDPQPVVTTPAPPQPAAPPVAAPANAVTPGQPLPGMAAPPPQQAVPVAASQSNVKPPSMDYSVDFDIKWIGVSKIINVAHDAGVRAQLTENKWDDKLPPERIFDLLLPDPFEQRNHLTGKLEMTEITDEVRKAWHNAVLKDILGRLGELSIKPSFSTPAADPKFECPEPAVEAATPAAPAATPTVETQQA